jgi:phosphoribosylformimino-5-aminoimidazole carboxamide ribotide isomerase
MIIIPAIDIMNGKCVRLSQGDFASQKIYSENPLDVARSFEDAGFSHLHIVDLDGAKAGQVKHWSLVESIATKTTLKVDFGGGIKTEEEIARLLSMGVAQVNLGSIAFKSPEKVEAWLGLFGGDKIILSADSNKEILAVAGWVDQTTISVIDFIQGFIPGGLQFATCTDIAKDGMMAGPNVALYKKIDTALPTIKLIASGGATTLNDLEMLAAAGCYGCIVGKAIYEGSIPLNSLAQFSSGQNVKNNNP